MRRHVGPKEADWVEAGEKTVVRKVIGVIKQELIQTSESGNL